MAGDQMLCQRIATPEIADEIISILVQHERHTGRSLVARWLPDARMDEEPLTG